MRLMALFIPEAAVGAPLGTRVVVGGGRGREAIRAVHDALPFLQGAQSVEVVSISPLHKEGSSHLSCADICTHIQHNIEPTRVA